MSRKNGVQGSPCQAVELGDDRRNSLGIVRAGLVLSVAFRSKKNEIFAYETPGQIRKRVRNRRFRLLCLLLVTSLIGYRFLRTPELIFEGRPLGEWLTRLESPDPSERALAKKALQEIGPTAVGPLLEMTRSSKPSIVRKTIYWFNDFEIFTIPVEDFSLRHQKALRGLTAIGPSAIEPLVQLMKSKKLALPAHKALQIFGDEAIIPLCRILDHEDPLLRSESALALGKFGLHARSCQSSLARCLQDGDDEVRASAAWALGEIQADSSMIPLLIEALEDKSPRVRRFSAYALGRYGPMAFSAVAGLQKMAGQTGATEASQAARTAIQQIQAPTTRVSTDQTPAQP